MSGTQEPETRQESQQQDPPPRQQAPTPRMQEPRREEPRHEEPRQVPRTDTIADVRAEAASYRIAARTAREEADEANRQLEAMRATIENEKTKVTAPLQTKMARLQQRMIDATLASKMVAAGLVDPDLVALASKMPDAPKLALDDNDEVQGVDDMVEKFKKWKPDYFRKAGEAPKQQEQQQKAPPKQTSAGGEPTPSGQQPSLDVRKMPKAEYAKWKADQLKEIARAGWNRQ
jgi:hypothetical protein